MTFRVFPELPAAVKAGTKRAIMRRGRRSVETGLLLLSSGDDTFAVRVTSTIQKLFLTLTDEDAYADGVASVEVLKNALLSIYPGLGERSIVTVVNFEPLCGEAQHQAKVTTAVEGTRS